MNMRVDGGKKRRGEVPGIVGRPLPDRIGIFDADRRPVPDTGFKLSIGITLGL